MVLFLGSGVSKLPDVKKITDSLFCDKWRDHSDQTYVLDPDPNEKLCPGGNWVPLLQEFLKFLKTHADKYLTSHDRPESNYEDIYYLAQQLMDEEYGGILNPIVADLAQKAKKKVLDLDDPNVTCRLIPDVRYKPDLRYKEVVSRTRTFIQCVVAHMLRTDKAPEGLDLIRELARSDQIKRLDIFTLNHDLLVETLLKAEGIPFVDGFGDHDGDVRYFDPDLYDDPTQKVRLFKLHGSIDWYRLRGTNNKTTPYSYAQIPGCDPSHCRDPKGPFLHNLDVTPLFLTGTYNKILDYGYGIYADMFWQLHSVLKSSDKMLMSGYGWNDRGINGRLNEWLHSSTNKCLCLLHKNPEHVEADKPKSAMWRFYNKWKSDERLVLIKKWLSNTKLEDLPWDLR